MVRRRLLPSLLVSAVTAATVLAAQPTAVQAAPVADPAAAVNPLVGTTNNGETFPGAVTPYGTLAWSPENTNGDQTRTVAPGGYSYNATRIRGFSLTHMSGTGCAGGSGDIPFMPYPGTVTSSPTADNTDSTYASNFSHANETANAGYYRVGLDSGVNVELTATARTGSGRFTYPAGRPATMLVRTAHSEVGSSAAQTRIDVANRTISGSVTSGNFCGYINQVGRRSYYTLHFVAVFDQGFTSTGGWQDSTLTPGATTSSGGTTYGTNGWPPARRGSGAYVTFDTSQTTSVRVRVGISYVSQANALANLNAENPAGTPFDTVRQQAKDAWNTALRRMEISGGTPAQQRTFYTALYHSLIHPTIVSDVNGQYLGPDNQVHTVSGGQRAQYGNFSGWDVYRNQIQLVTLLQPDVGSDIAQSLLNHANQNNGVWDRWIHNQGGTHVMTGDPGHAAVASIHAFGGTAFDVQGALNSMVRAATTPTALDRSREGWNVMVVGERPSLDKYLQLGYVPSDGNAWGGAGETLEVGAADFGIAQLAGRLGDTGLRDRFTARAQGWKKVFNPANGGYIQERHSNGSWLSHDPASDDGFAEGSSAQYTWMIPFNVKGLFAAMGGNATAVSRLDAFFRDNAGNWSFRGGGGLDADMTNEPSIGTPWLYNFAGAPWKTQQTVRQVVNTLWSDTPGGIPGQDDLGAMSAWYVFAAAGLYPLTPGRAELLLAAPLFSQVAIHRSNGVDITVNAPAATTNAAYIQSLSVNGTASNRSWLPESIVASGGTVDVVVGTTANTGWGAAAADAPPSWDVGSTPLPTNLALNRPATADSECVPTEAAGKAVNGSVSGGSSDKWCSGGAQKWLRMDLGSAVAVRTVAVKHAAAGGESATWNTRDYDVEVSTDAVNWTTVVRQRGNTAASTTHSVSATARYLRLNVITPEQSGAGAARIYEFEVYG